jgi:hypothetical protein
MPMRAVLTAAFVLFAASIAAAHEPLPAEPGIPACNDEAVLSNIVERQHWAEAHTWKNGVRIELIDEIRQNYPGTDFVSAIDHRHCNARVVLGPRHASRLWYMISKESGFASISWYVDFCISGHDPYRVYNADCRVLK